MSCQIIVFHSFSVFVIWEILILLLLLAGSAMMSASEVSFFSLKPAELKRLEEHKSKKNLLILKLLENPDRLLANILIANNFINISVVILSSYITNSIVDFSQAPLLGFIFQVVVVTFLLVLVGEIIPKVFASYKNVRTAQLMAYIMDLLSTLLFPISYLLLKTSSVVNKRLASKKPDISIDDLSHALDITSASLSEERTLLKGIVRFGNIDVSEIMHPRMDIVAIEDNLSFSKLLSVIVASGYSRIPVFHESLDNIKGILYTKDILPYLNESHSFHWQALVKQAYFVPETKKIDDLLAEFQKKKTHFAVVVDEYGGTCGIVTMEDILEEIIGEISDESDVEEEVLYKLLEPNVWLCEAKLLLNDFFKITGIDDTSFDDIKGEFETLAGLILEIKGEIPQKGESIQHKNVHFTIEAVDKRRIKQIKIWIKNK